MFSPRDKQKLMNRGNLSPRSAAAEEEKRKRKDAIENVVVNGKNLSPAASPMSTSKNLSLRRSTSIHNKFWRDNLSMRVGAPASTIVALFALYRYALKNGGVKKLVEHLVAALKKVANWKKFM